LGVSQGGLRTHDEVREDGAEADRCEEGVRQGIERSMDEGCRLVRDDCGWKKAQVFAADGSHERYSFFLNFYFRGNGRIGSKQIEAMRTKVDGITWLLKSVRCQWGKARCNKTFQE